MGVVGVAVGQYFCQLYQQVFAVTEFFVHQTTVFCIDQCQFFQFHTFRRGSLGQIVKNFPSYATAFQIIKGRCQVKAETKVAALSGIQIQLFVHIFHSTACQHRLTSIGQWCCQQSGVVGIYITQ